MNFFQTDRSRSIYHNLNFLEIYTNVVDTHYNVEKNDFFDEKFVFCDIHLQINFTKTFKNYFHMLDVNLANFAVNQNIVQITLYKIIDVISQNIVHVMLIIDEIVDELEKQNLVFVKIQKNDERNEILAI